MQVDKAVPTVLMGTGLLLAGQALSNICMALANDSASISNLLPILTSDLVFSFGDSSNLAHRPWFTMVGLPPL